MSFKKSLELEGQGRGIIMGIDTLTSARAILHHTDQKGPNILHPSVLLMHFCQYLSFTVLLISRGAFQNISLNTYFQKLFVDIFKEIYFLMCLYMWK